ncbi:hypothetical protein R1sor_022320 [Riccia sorocarpa]|uniref:Phytosulfokine-beta n=1 Tax=Riccia sorocarpa TaxID=122646 RepID=A0ABD3GLQ4_9MARC
MKKAYIFLGIFCATLALVSQLAEARPDSGMRSEVWNRRRLRFISADGTLAPSLTESAKDSQVGGNTEGLPQHEKVDGAVQQERRERQETELERTEESDDDEVVCTESGSCYEKRVLTATIDYKADGPNNPITDPPH